MAKIQRRLQPFNACVARPVGRVEIASNPSATTMESLLTTSALISEASLGTADKEFSLFIKRAMRDLASFVVSEAKALDPERDSELLSIALKLGKLSAHQTRLEHECQICKYTHLHVKANKLRLQAESGAGDGDDGQMSKIMDELAECFVSLGADGRDLAAQEAGSNAAGLAADPADSDEEW